MPAATAPLAAKSCTPCRGGVPPLGADEVERSARVPREGVVRLLPNSVGVFPPVRPGACDFTIARDEVRLAD